MKNSKFIKGDFANNLKKVIDMLKTNKHVIGNINMDLYQKDNSNVEHECQSTGCVIGHSVRLLTDKDFFLLEKQKKKQKTSAYFILCKEYFGVDSHSDTWYFLFGENWADSEEFAAERILLFLLVDRNIKSIEDIETGEYLYEEGITSILFLYYEKKKHKTIRNHY